MRILGKAVTYLFTTFIVVYVYLLLVQRATGVDISTNPLLLFQQLMTIDIGGVKPTDCLAWIHSFFESKWSVIFTLGLDGLKNFCTTCMFIGCLCVYLIKWVLTCIPVILGF